MPSTVDGLLTKVGLDKSLCKTVKWGQPLDTNAIGIYFVTTAKDRNTNANLFDKAPIDDTILKFWVNKIPTIEIDNVRNSNIVELKKRLNSFWLPDENIIYVGQTESGLRSRVGQFYRTEIGERKPHAGGHWIKTLKILNDTFIHYLPTSNPVDHEEEILRQFIANVSEKTRKNIGDPIMTLPFANLQLDRSNRKKHGIKKSKIGD